MSWLENRLITDVCLRLLLSQFHKHGIKRNHSSWKVDCDGSNFEKSTVMVPTKTTPLGGFSLVVQNPNQSLLPEWSCHNIMGLTLPMQPFLSAGVDCWQRIEYGSHDFSDERIAPVHVDKMSTWPPNVQCACPAPLHQLKLRFTYTPNSRSRTHLFRRNWFDCLITVSLSRFFGNYSLWKTHTLTRVISFQILGSWVEVAADFA